MIELVSYLQPVVIHRINRDGETIIELNLSKPNSELGKPNKGNENKI